MELRGKNVTVVGLARSGLAACNLLLKKGARVSITDCLNNARTRENLRSLENQKNIIKVEIGRHTAGLIDGQQLIVASPGVPMDSLPLQRAREKGIAVISEIELAFNFCPAPVIAITGTNGKTTVTTLVGEILKAAGRKSVVCGNIGNPFSAQVEGLSKRHLVVLEISSFQLEGIERFKPKVAVMLNLSADHLDRYANFGEYLKAKCRIFANQDRDDWALLNQDEPQRDLLQKYIKAKIVYFSKNKDLAGIKNRLNSNHYAAIAITSLLGIPEETALETARKFKGLKHRLEEVASIRGVKFINDSKATNIDSTVWALNSIREQIVLIAGGRDKGSDFSTLGQDFMNKLRAVVLLGEAKEKIAAAFNDKIPISKVTDLARAVEQALILARPGDCVLLSPMCASFDMFTDYAQRGEVFKKAVYDLLNHKSQIPNHK